MIFFETLIKILMLFLGLAVINARNPVYSVLSLILLFLLSAILLIYLGVSFIGMVFLVVYIGAVSVLFLFVVMMLNIRHAELTSSELYYLPVNGLLFLIPLSIEFYQYFKNYSRPFNDPDIMSVDYLKLLTSLPDSEVLGAMLYGFEFGFSVLLAALILLVAMIGSIVLTQNFRNDVKKQDMFSQLSSAFTTSINIYSIKPKT